MFKAPFLAFSNKEIAIKLHLPILSMILKNAKNISLQAENNKQLLKILFSLLRSDESKQSADSKITRSH